MARLRLSAREQRCLAGVAPLILAPRGAKDAVPGTVGVAQDAPYVAELIRGFELFREGDDLRKLDQRVSEFVGADVAREYEEPRLDPILIVVDRSDSLAVLPDVIHAAHLVASSLGLALARGGHPVSVANTRLDELREVQPTRPDPLGDILPTLSHVGRDKTGVRAWVDRLRLTRRTFGRVVLVTDATWTARDYCAVLRSLQGLARFTNLLILTREEEYREVSTDRVRGPGSAALVPAPAVIRRRLHQWLARLGRWTDRTGRGALTVIRWDDRAGMANRLVASLPDLLD